MTEPNPPTTGATAPVPNPVHYAETVLKVHEVWQEATDRLTTLEADQRERSSHLHELRSIRASQDDREAEIVADVAREYSELSDTARNKLVKAAVHSDAAHRELRSRERSIQALLDICDADISHDEKGLTVLSARMVELGGLLNFYAASKQQHTSTSPHTDSESK